MVLFHLSVDQEIIFAVGDGKEMIGMYALLHQEISDGIASVGAKSVVVSGRAALVTVSLDEHIQIRRCLHVACDFLDDIEIIIAFQDAGVVFKMDILKYCSGPWI